MSASKSSLAVTATARLKPQRPKTRMLTVVDAREHTAKSDQFAAELSLQKNSKKGNGNGKEKRNKNEFLNEVNQSDPSTSTGQKSDKDARPVFDTSTASFKNIVREVEAVGAKRFTKYEKRAHEKRVMEELTGREYNTTKIPITIWKGMQSKNHIREDRKRQREKDAGLVVKKLSKVRRVTNVEM